MIKFIKQILGINNKNPQSKTFRLRRDFEILNSILQKEKKILYFMNTINCNNSKINVYCVTSGSTNMPLNNRKSICDTISSKKYTKSITKLLKRNDDDFLFHFTKWKSWQIINKESNWKIFALPINISHNKQFVYIYNNIFQIRTHMSVLSSISKFGITSTFDIYNQLDTNSLLQNQLFELKIKEYDAKKDLFFFFEKILYSPETSFSSFWGKNT